MGYCKLLINWCRISFINSSLVFMLFGTPMFFLRRIQTFLSLLQDPHVGDVPQQLTQQVFEAFYFLEMFCLSEVNLSQQETGILQGLHFGTRNLKDYETRILHLTRRRRFTGPTSMASCMNSMGGSLPSMPAMSSIPHSMPESSSVHGSVEASLVMETILGEVRHEDRFFLSERSHFTLKLELLSSSSGFSFQGRKVLHGRPFDIFCWDP